MADVNMPPGAGAPGAAARQVGRIKGTLLIARMKYLRAQGTETADRVLRRLTADDRAALEGMLLPSAWYPASLLLRLEMTIAAILARGDRARLFVDMGRFSADANLGENGVQRAFLKPGDPHFLLLSVPRMYSAQHTSGHRTYEAAGERAAIVRTFGAEDADADDCLTAVGWLARAIEISGGTSVRVHERQCAARGAPCCEYVCEWS